MKSLNIITYIIFYIIQILVVNTSIYFFFNFIKKRKNKDYKVL